MKKKICMLLAGTMLAGSLGTTGFAQEETTTTEPMEADHVFSSLRRRRTGCTD